VDRINDSGFAFLSQASLEGRRIIRWAIGNFQTEWRDVAETWERVREAVP
jgi:hypothetical protein